MINRQAIKLRPLPGELNNIDRQLCTSKLETGSCAQKDHLCQGGSSKGQCSTNHWKKSELAMVAERRSPRPAPKLPDSSPIKHPWDASDKQVQTYSSKRIRCQHPGARHHSAPPEGLYSHAPRGQIPLAQGLCYSITMLQQIGVQYIIDILYITEFYPLAINSEWERLTGAEQKSRG